MNEEEYSPEELAQIQSALGEMGISNYPTPQEQSNIYSLFKKILMTKDSSKVGFLDEKELYAVRMLQHLKLFMGVTNYDLVKKYLGEKAEVILATSLSKKAKFIEAAITQKRQLATERKSGTWEGKKWKKKQDQEA